MDVAHSLLEPLVNDMLDERKAAPVQNPTILAPPLRRPIMRKTLEIAGVALTVAVVVAFASMTPSLVRYVKMSRM